jgi:hypothetical protein
MQGRNFNVGFDRLDARDRRIEPPDSEWADVALFGLRSLPTD